MDNSNSWPIDDKLREIVKAYELKVDGVVEGQFTGQIVTVVALKKTSLIPNFPALVSDVAEWMRSWDEESLYRWSLIGGAEDGACINLMLTVDRDAEDAPMGSPCPTVRYGVDAVDAEVAAQLAYELLKAKRVFPELTMAAILGHAFNEVPDDAWAEIYDYDLVVLIRDWVTEMRK